MGQHDRTENRDARLIITANERNDSNIWAFNIDPCKLKYILVVNAAPVMSRYENAV